MPVRVTGAASEVTGAASEVTGRAAVATGAASAVTGAIRAAKEDEGGGRDGAADGRTTPSGAAAEPRMREGAELRAVTDGRVPRRHEPGTGGS